MLPPMPFPRTRAGLGAGALLLLLGCDDRAWLSLHHVASFREVAAPAGHDLAQHPGAHLLQVGRGPGAWSALPGSRVVQAEESWPDDVASGGPVVLVAVRREEGLRLAARMARAGIQDVVLVSGGVAAWQAAARSEDEVQRHTMTMRE